MTFDDHQQVGRFRVDLDVIVGSFPNKAAVECRSRKSPAAIVASAQSHILAVGGLSVQMRPDVFRFLLALLALRGAPFSRDDAEFFLWGDREDGGPESWISVLAQLVMSARAAAAVIGYRIENHHGVGWSAHRALSDQSLQAAE